MFSLLSNQLRRLYMPAKPLGIAVIGCGYWGINYVRLLTQLPDINLIAVCDQSQDRLHEISKRFPEPKYVSNVDEVAGMEGVDAAIVCTNPASHYKVAAPLLEAKKHLLIEKPITTLSSDAQKLVDKAHEQKLILMVGHIFLYNSAIRKVKQYLENGDAGEVYYVYARRTNLGPFRSDVNALWDLAPHDIYIINYFLGQSPEWVSAIGVNFLRQPNCEDVGFITLGYPKGILGNIHVSWANPHKEREIVVVASKQRIVFDDTSTQDKVRVFEKGVTTAKEPMTFGEHQLSIRDGDIIIPNVPVSEPLKAQVIEFIDCMRQGKKPLSDGNSGLDVIRVMEAVDTSVAKNGEPVQIKK